MAADDVPQVWKLSANNQWDKVQPVQLKGILVNRMKWHGVSGGKLIIDLTDKDYYQFTVICNDDSRYASLAIYDYDQRGALGAKGAEYLTEEAPLPALFSGRNRRSSVLSQHLRMRGKKRIYVETSEGESQLFVSTIPDP